MYTAWMADKRMYRSFAAAKKRAKELVASAPETVDILMYRGKTERDAGLSTVVWASNQANEARKLRGE